MTFAEDKTYDYIRRHYQNFCCIHVLEILPHLSCLTASDQELLRACYDRRGNQNTIWELFNSLRRRSGWVDSLIRALRACEQAGLADKVAHVYQSYLPLNQNCPQAPLEPPSVPAVVPDRSTPTVAPSAPHNSYSDEEPSYPMPVQDTQSPKSLGESSKKAPQTSSSGAVLRRPDDPSSDMEALCSLTSSVPQEQDTDLGNTHIAGVVSSLTSPRGPVSPTVSFQPLARSTPRASCMPEPLVSAVSTGTTSSSSRLAFAGGAGDQAEPSISSSGTRVPTNSVTTSTVPSKVPPTSAFTRTVPSKLPTSSKPPGIMPTNVLAPSRLPINSTDAGSVPPKVPTGLVSDHRVPTSTVLSKVPAKTEPTIRSSNGPSKDTPVSPAPTGATAGGSSPCAESTSDSLNSEPQLSKPGRLVSQLDSEPFSVCSADLAISCPDTLDVGSNNAPEENEYVSVNTLSIHVAEAPSTDNLAGNPGPQAALPLQAEEESVCVMTAPWAPWLGAAAAGALLAVLLAMLYRRRPLQ